MKQRISPWGKGTLILGMACLIYGSVFGFWPLALLGIVSCAVVLRNAFKRRR